VGSTVRRYGDSLRYSRKLEQRKQLINQERNRAPDQRGGIFEENISQWKIGENGGNVNTRSANLDDNNVVNRQ
jgi:hypothetical protein